MMRTTLLLCLLAFSACTITIDPVDFEDKAREPSQTMQGVELSTKIVEDENGNKQRLVAPFLEMQLDRKIWMKHRLWARKTFTRPFAPDLVLEIQIKGPKAAGIYEARDSTGNKLAILSKSLEKIRMRTETIQIVLVPKHIQQNNNQDYLVVLRGKAPGSKSRTYEVELPAYYHRGFMNRYKNY